MKTLKMSLALLCAAAMILPLFACGPTSGGEFIIGLDDTFAPMGFRDEAGNLVGFDIDLATEVCKELGMTPKFQPIDWDSKEMELNSKKIDCIWNGMSITPERQVAMSLSKAYLNNKIIVMTVAGAAIATKDDLKNYNLGTQAKSSALEVVQADAIYPDIKDKLTEYRSYDDVILDMQAGRIDAMIVDEVLGTYKNTMLGGIFSVSAVNFGEDLYAIGFRKEDVELTKKIEDGIAKLVKNGKAADISKKWFGEDIVIKWD